MRLLLTSFGIKNKLISQSLDEMTGISRSTVKIGFVPTAANKEPGDKSWFLDQLFQLKKMGYLWIDIVDFSASNIDWKVRLSECDVIFISGGNTFHLLSETKNHGFDKWIKDNLSEKVFVGSSAGSILFTPTIEIAKVEPADIDYTGLTDFKALNIVDFELSPHTPEQLSYEANEKYAKSTNRKLYTLDDDSAIAVVDENIKIVSSGKVREYN